MLYRHDKRWSKKEKQNIQEKISNTKRSLSDSEKNLNPLDKIEKEEYEKQVEKIAYAMIIPPVGSMDNVKIKVMDYIESKIVFSFPLLCV